MHPTTPEEIRLYPYTNRGASLELARLLLEWEKLMQQKQVSVLIYCIYRSDAAQRVLYAQGRTTPGRICTNAKAGQSAHNRTTANRPASDAFDACPLIDNKPTWATKGKALLYWNEMGCAAETLGLQWGRHYKNLGGDWSHFQFDRPTPKT